MIRLSALLVALLVVWPAEAVRKVSEPMITAVPPPAIEVIDTTHLPWSCWESIEPLLLAIDRRRREGIEVIANLHITVSEDAICLRQIWGTPQ